jgi:hypothetical protein
MGRKGILFLEVNFLHQFEAHPFGLEGWVVPVGKAGSEYLSKYFDGVLPCPFFTWHASTNRFCALEKAV